MPKDIPINLTEYLFWFLFSLCCIYIFIIKKTIIQTNNTYLKEIFEIFYKPLNYIDDLLKKNKKLGYYFYICIKSIYELVPTLSYFQMNFIYYIIQIFTRLLLLSVLLIDIFYFHQIALFYKIILISVFLLIEKYIIFSLNKERDRLITTLKEKYDTVLLIYLDTKESELTIDEYIEFRMEHLTDPLLKGLPFSATPFANEIVFKNYCLEHYNTTDIELADHDFIKLQDYFNNTFPIILNINLFSLIYSSFDKQKLNKNIKLLIYALYLFCWSYILFISYKYFPIDYFHIAKYFINNCMYYLCNVNNPFSDIP